MLDLQIQVRVESRAGWDQVAQDDVFLQTYQRVDHAGQGGFGENPCCLLQAGGTDDYGTLRVRSSCKFSG